MAGDLFGAGRTAAVTGGGLARGRTQGAVRADEPERALFGSYPTRNMVSDETGLPTKWDLKTGANIKWSQPGLPELRGPRGPRREGLRGHQQRRRAQPEDQGRQGRGHGLPRRGRRVPWQMVTDKLPSGRVNDWPQQGVCSTPFVEGNRLYYTSNQARIVCLDTEGFKDGKTTGDDREVQGRDRRRRDLGIRHDGRAGRLPHNLAASSPLVVDDLLYVITGNGVDEGHVTSPRPGRRASSP